MKPAMPRPYRDDLRWRAIGINEFLRYSVDDYPQYLSGLSRALLLFLPTTFLETAVYTCVNSTAADKILSLR